MKNKEQTNSGVRSSSFDIYLQNFLSLNFNTLSFNPDRKNDNRDTEFKESFLNRKDGMIM